MPRFLESLSEKLQHSATVKAIYGDPVEAEGKTVIPVARIAYGLGGGYGKMKTYEAQGRKQEQPVGQGGGGGITVTPLGVIEITREHTRYVPLRQGTAKWAGAFLAGLAVGLLVRRG